MFFILESFASKSNSMQNIPAKGKFIYFLLSLIKIQIIELNRLKIRRIMQNLMENST